MSLKRKHSGANAVLLGRPFVYGLAVAGENGVRHVLKDFINDIDVSLALTGFSSLQQVNHQSFVKRNKHFAQSTPPYLHFELFSIHIKYYLNFQNKIV